MGLKRKKSSLLLVSLFIMTLLLAACGGNSSDDATGEETEKPSEDKEVINLTIGGGHAANALEYTVEAVEYFQPEIERRVSEETDYEIKWTEGYGGTISTLEGSLDAVQNGLLDVGVISFAFTPQELFLANFTYYIPFHTSDPRQAVKITRKVIDEVPEFEELFGKYNQKFLALGPTGPYELLTTFPVESIDDLEGKRIAAAGPNLNFLKATKASGVQSDLGEAYTAMQTGVYDGWIMWGGPIIKNDLHEVAKYYTKVGFGAMPIQGITINSDTWNSLPSEVQDIISEVSLEYEEKASERAYNDSLAAEDEFEDMGLTVTELSAEEVNKWAENMPNVPKMTAEELDELGYPGTKVMELYMKYLQEDGFDMPREWDLD